jgi:hypothetical protein
MIEVALRKSFPGPLSASGHGTCTDLRAESERQSKKRNSTREAEVNAPEETDDMTRTQARPAHLTECGKPKKKGEGWKS